MSAKLWLIFAMICMLSIEAFGFPTIQRMKRSSDEEEDKESDKDSHKDDEKGEEKDGDKDADKDTDKNADKDDNVDDDDDDDVLPFGIKLGSQQDSQSISENVGKGKAKALQQHHLGQQQLAAAIGGKHYVLQQQNALGQQLAKLGKKTAIQQLADVQKQAIANGRIIKTGKVETQETVVDSDDAEDSDGN